MAIITGEEAHMILTVHRLPTISQKRILPLKHWIYNFDDHTVWNLYPFLDHILIPFTQYSVFLFLNSRGPIF